MLTITNRSTVMEKHGTVTFKERSLILQFDLPNWPNRPTGKSTPPDPDSKTLELCLQRIFEKKKFNFSLARHSCLKQVHSSKKLLLKIQLLLKLKILCCLISLVSYGAKSFHPKCK